MGVGGLSEGALAAIEAAAERYSMTVEGGQADSPAAYLTIDGKRIAVTVAAIKLGVDHGGKFTKPRLRFDRVALRLVRELQAALSGSVPDGEAVVVTITAPIRLPAKTAASLAGWIRDCLAGQPRRTELKDTIYGNQIRVRLVTGVSGSTSKVIGFVHNPDSGPNVLLGLTQSMLQSVGAAADRPPPEDFTGDRWLVVVHEQGFAHVETYRQVYAQLGISTDFKRSLLVLAGGRVEDLIG